MKKAHKYQVGDVIKSKNKKASFLIKKIISAQEYGGVLSHRGNSADGIIITEYGIKAILNS